MRGFINSGGDLLSRDLSSDYHRRADVSLPGSEWDRVGPSGYDHQAAAFSYAVRLTVTLPVGFFFSLLCFPAFSQQPDIRVAFLCV